MTFIVCDVCRMPRFEHVVPPELQSKEGDPCEYAPTLGCEGHYKNLHPESDLEKQGQLNALLEA